MSVQAIHAELVSSLAKSGSSILESLEPSKVHLLHMIMGVSGESGELLDAIKKHVMYNKPIDLENVIEELGDIEFYLQGLRSGLALNRDEILQRNIDKLTKRYGDSYSDTKAQVRADKAEGGTS